ncbi:heat-inducible transcriptional repressor HrcA [Romeria aff. gracilis LEGE 07310]|uniref:Heat-inducible transcription repressor HrcA n=1 Tax=Vasconcelosia minhoensis LEGE 07310 TaxID=915328 RepID=A0A8J7DMP3_9CYAN|nr:heat-inducible transcriptional repressor HrcA [Romeria gracilis]MBE9077060.1 heat-inducible transcriptional repressor HrcA [Romeria aff. gracilis LEGE 07310]
MEKPVQLNARQQRVLWATVRHYVMTAEPVGSKSLATGYDLQVSSATIRNAMGVLERSGLLYQPHTSAGRIPSDSGYRFYVDDLLEPSPSLTRQVEAALTERLDWEGWSVEALLQETAQVLARLSGYIALVTLPQTHAVCLQHLQLVRVEGDQILLVVMLDAYSTRSILVQFPKATSQAGKEQLDRELQILSNFLNHRLRGKPLSAIVDLEWAELDRAFQHYAETLQGAISGLAQRTRSTPASQIVFSGLAEVLRQPEFASDQLHDLIYLLEDGRDQLWPLIAAAGEPAAEPLRIWIGAENPLEPMQTCALVSAVYSKDRKPLGSVGLLGPTRMLYENAITAVESAAAYLTRAVTQGFRGLNSGT